MSDELHARAFEVWRELLDVPTAERDDYLTRACDGNPELRAEIESLIACDEQTSDLFDEGEIDQRRSKLAGALEGVPPDPERIDDYRIVRRIGAGGMGVVYEAEQEHPKRRVAIKLMLPHTLSGKLMARFRTEVELLGRLQHEGIAQIYGADSHDFGFGGQPYFAMEFVDGVDLMTWARRPGVTTEKKLELFVRLCDAVHHAHQRGVVHRDLKPENVLVAEDGRFKVLDFGIARATESDIQLTTMRTEVGQLVGTIPYMSPEQASGDARELDARSDIYTLGVVLYQLLTDRMPYELGGRSIPEAVRVIQEEEPTRAGSIDTRFRGDIDTILHKALEKDPTRRFASADALGAEVSRYLRHEPIVSRPPSTLYQLHKFVRRHTGLTVGVSLAFVALATGLAVALSFGSQARQRLEQAQRRNYATQLSVIADSIAKGEDVGDELIDPPPGVRPGWEWRYLQARATPELWRTPVEGRIGAVRFSPNATHVVTFESERSLGVWTAWGDRVRTLTAREPLQPGRHLAVGRRLALTTTGTGRVVAFDYRTGQLEYEGPPGEKITAFAWDDARGRVAFARSSSNMEWRYMPSEVWAGTLQGTKAVATLPQAARWLAWSAHERKLLAATHTHLGRLDCDNWTYQDVTRVQGFHGALAYAADAGAITFSRATPILQTWTLSQDMDTLAAFRREYRGHRHPTFSAVRSSADARRIVSVANQGTHTSELMLWDAEVDGPRTLAAFAHGEWAQCDISQNGRFVALREAGRLRVWDLRPAVLRHRTFVYFVDFSPDGKTIASQDFRGRLRLWDAAESTPLSGWLATTIWGHGFAFTPDGEHLVFSGGENPARWNLATLAGTALPIARKDSLPRMLAEHAGAPVSGQRFALSPDGRHWVTTDGEVRDTRTGEKVRMLRTGFEAHNKVTSAASFAPSGHRVAIANHGVARIYDFRGGGLLRQLPAPGVIYSVAWSPDGDRIATGARDGTIRLWDGRSYEFIMTVNGHTNYVHDLAWSPDGTRLVSASGDKTVRIWDSVAATERRAQRVATQRVRARMRRRVERIFHTEAPERVVELLRDDDELSQSERHEALRCLRELCLLDLALDRARAQTDGFLDVLDRDRSAWEWRRHQARFVPAWSESFGNEGSDIRHVRFTPDSRHVIAFAERDSIGVWTTNGTQLRTLSAGTELTGHALCVGAKLAIAAARDGSLLVFEHGTGHLQRRGAKGLPVTALAWDEARRRIAVARAADPYAWSVDTEAELSVGTLDKQAVVARGKRRIGQLAWGVNGHPLIVATELEVSSFSGANWKRRLLSNKASYGFGFARRASIIATPKMHGFDTWFVAAGAAPISRRTRGGHAGRYISALSATPDGLRWSSIARGPTANSGGELLVWDETSAPSRVLARDVRISARCEISPDGRFVATRERSRLRVWDLSATDRLTRTLALEGEVVAVRFSSDSRVLVARDASGASRAWDAWRGSPWPGTPPTAPTGSEATAPDARRDFTIDKAQTRCVARSPDGSRIATGGDDGKIRLWKAQGCEFVVALSGHTGPIRDLAWSPDGTMLASAASDRTVRVWDSVVR